jgi:hypothetical protein
MAIIIQPTIDGTIVIKRILSGTDSKLILTLVVGCFPKFQVGNNKPISD